LILILLFGGRFAREHSPPPPPDGMVPEVILNREYVYSAGDGLAGLDELLVQYGPDRSAWWVIQDAGGDCIGLARAVSGQPTQLVWQASYDAYGTPISVVDHAPHERLHAGHKGLFVERLDAAAVQLPTFQDTPRLWPGAVLAAHARNRTLLTHLGRWGQMDPNATGAMTMHAWSRHGRSWMLKPGIFDLRDHFTDGTNVYGYLKGSPVQMGDPLGLWVSNVFMAGFGALRGGVEAMVGRYAWHMESDSDWATDFSQGDDWHSRLDSSWVGESFRAGMMSGLLDELDPTGGFIVDYAEDDGLVLAGRKPLRKLPGMPRIGELAGFAKTWQKHGSEQAEELIRQARSGRSGPQGWFTNKVHTERYLSKFVNTPGTRTVDMPPGLGRIALPDGRIVQATKMRLVMKGTRAGKPRLDHAYPYWDGD
jgi:hypothetical protein